MGTVRRLGRLGELLNVAANPPDGHHIAWSTTTGELTFVAPPEAGIGPQGPQGVPGEAGATGAPGSQGPAGNDGSQGIQGSPGDTGAAGADGAQGSQGIQGIQGPQGDAGSQGPAGPGVPTGGSTGQVLAKTSSTDFATAWTTPSVGGGGIQGTTTIDFGAFPGKSDTLATVTGQAGITEGSLVRAWLRLSPTSDHSVDEHWLETLRIEAGNIVAGVGFTIYGVNTSQLNEPLMQGGSGRAATTVVGAQSADAALRLGGRGTRLYGQWSVNWSWS